MLAPGSLWGPEGTTVEGPAQLGAGDSLSLQPLADNSNLGTADERKCFPSGVKLPFTEDMPQPGPSPEGQSHGSLRTQRKGRPRPVPHFTALMKCSASDWTL